VTDTTYLPTVLVIDDDPAVHKYMRRRFHAETSVGLVQARSLRDAKALMDSSEVKIHAVIADLFFDPAYCDPENDLNDGLDILAYSLEKRPEATQYVLSIFSEMDPEHHKAERLKLPIQTWFQKLYQRSDAGAQAPWAQVERDLLRKRFSEDPSLKVRLEEMGYSLHEPPDPMVLSESIRGALRFPIRTYIQSLDDPKYQIIRPIEVLCTKEASDQVTATAPRLGLLADGVGESVDEALSNLSSYILDLVEVLREEPASDVSGYLHTLQDRLRLYIRGGVTDEKE
jgi:hypothetical protein